MPALLSFLAKKVDSSPHLDFYLHWIKHTLEVWGERIQRDPLASTPAQTALLRSMSRFEDTILNTMEDNYFMLETLEGTDV